MIALDTNILARHLVQDHPTQSILASDFLENELTRTNQGFVSTIVLLELNWVLQSIYHVDKKTISQIIFRILSLPNIVVEASGAVRAALKHDDQSFSDALIHEIGKANGCAHTLTFDKKFGCLYGVETLV